MENNTAALAKAVIVCAEGKEKSRGGGINSPEKPVSSNGRIRTTSGLIPKFPTINEMPSAMNSNAPCILLFFRSSNTAAVKTQIAPKFPKEVMHTIALSRIGDRMFCIQSKICNSIIKSAASPRL